jgi:hypothetical protein
LPHHRTRIVAEGDMKNPFRDFEVEHALGLLGLWLALVLVRLANSGYGEQVTHADRISGFLARRGIDGIAFIGWLVDLLPQPAQSMEVCDAQDAVVRVWAGRL